MDNFTLMLKKYFVLYGDYDEWFVCDAENAQHAAEQARDHNDDVIHAVFEAVQDDNWVNK